MNCLRILKWPSIYRVLYTVSVLSNNEDGILVYLSCKEINSVNVHHCFYYLCPVIELFVTNLNKKWSFFIRKRAPIKLNGFIACIFSNGRVVLNYVDCPFNQTLFLGLGPLPLPISLVQSMCRTRGSGNIFLKIHWKHLR